MVMRLEPNLLHCDVKLCVQVRCKHLAIEEKFRGYEMSSDTESNSFTNLLTSSDEDINISSFRPYWFDL